MSQIILYLLFFVYAYFADQAISYVKANIMGIRGEVVYGSLITYYGQRIVWAIRSRLGNYSHRAHSQEFYR